MIAQPTAYMLTAQDIYKAGIRAFNRFEKRLSAGSGSLFSLQDYLPIIDDGPKQGG